METVASTVEAAPGLVRVSEIGTAMGGRLGDPRGDLAGRAEDARRDALRAVGRVRAWARILTRHDPGSPLMRLNGDPRTAVPVGPTLAAALDWAHQAGRSTGGLVDVTMLAERLAAEQGVAPTRSPARGRTWSLVARLDGRPGGVVVRPPGLGLDLDGVAKGWLADRALRLLDRHPGALVEGDGDLAIRVAPGDSWEVGVADPHSAGEHLAVFVLDARHAAGWRRLGLATSGTSVHRWGRPGGGAHHLIDPRTGLPARTDVVQATVLAGSAAEAETWAKCAVLVGGAAGIDLLDRAGVAGAILLLADGRTVALPRTTEWLA